jgi:hypothetical protein
MKIVCDIIKQLPLSDILSDEMMKVVLYVQIKEIPSYWETNSEQLVRVILRHSRNQEVSNSSAGQNTVAVHFGTYKLTALSCCNSYVLTECLAFTEVERVSGSLVAGQYISSAVIDRKLVSCKY